MLHFNKEEGSGRKDNQADMYPYLDEEDMGDMIIDGERECLWRIVFEDNDGGVEDEKAILHTNRWGVYMNNKNANTGWLLYISVKF